MQPADLPRADEPLELAVAAALCGTSAPVVAFLVRVGALESAGTGKDGEPRVTAAALRRVDFSHLTPEALASAAGVCLSEYLGPTHLGVGYLARIRSAARHIVVQP